MAARRRPVPRLARNGRPLLQEWARQKAERGEVDGVVWVVAAIEEIIQDILDGKHSAGLETESARSYLLRHIETLREEARVSLGE